MNKLDKKDVIIIGGGVAGLFTAYKLSGLGLKVMLIEEQSQLCNGPSIKNGGLLHRGTFHSSLIEDELKAYQVSQRCMWGFEQIRTFAPECLERNGLPIYAIIKDEKLAERSIQRWEKWDIPIKLVSYEDFSSDIPGIDRQYAHFIFRVADVPVNYRILYQKLLVACERNEVEFIFDATFLPTEDNFAVIQYKNDNALSVQAESFVFTTGYKSKELIETYFPNTVNIKLWKSHALVFPLLKKHGFFFIDPGEVSVEPQGNYSIVCQSQEDTLVDTANFEINKGITEQIYHNLIKVLPEVGERKDILYPSACLKPAIVSSTKGPLRSVDIEIHELSKCHILALPGKATEAPCMADELVKVIFERQYDHRIALRPGDLFLKELKSMNDPHDGITCDVSSF